MIDLREIRDRPQTVLEAMSKRNTVAPIARIQALDEQRRALLSEVEQLRAQRNTVSREIARIADQDRREDLIAEMRTVGDRIRAIEEDLTAAEDELHDLLLQVPNIPHAEALVGADERANAVVRTEGEPRSFDFEPLPHWDLGPMLDIIDFDRGVRLAGSRFYVLKGLGAKLQRALINWMLDFHVNDQGYTEVYTPFLVKQEAMLAAGQLPKFKDNLYRDVEDDLWLVPTAEVPLTSMHRDEILAADELPISYVAYTACFRREKMSAGKDTRGIKRGHQFDKVEMYKFTRPERSDEELDRMIDDAEDVCRALGIPYRVVELCTGDIAFQAARSFDIELWAPGCDEWLEVSSLSTCTDFQARRANIRYRPKPGAKPVHVHTLNGSGLALPRVVIAILENYQQADGSITVPDVLLPYMRPANVIS